ncbi:MAG TPA: hypothetical protein VFQ65_23195, partial [Kofleriaceae bacterium]|nr:hypothetical protein [Kofleriaceae bacterium]
GGSSGGSNCGNAVSPAPTAYLHKDDNTPHAGRGCMDAAGCHNAGLGLGTNAPEYSYGGTVYTDAGGATPAAGSTIFITSAGTTKKLVADSAGNFFINPQLLAAPGNQITTNTQATQCPTITPMVGALVSGGGNCNAGGTCHNGTEGKIHL